MWANSKSRMEGGRVGGMVWCLGIRCIGAGNSRFDTENRKAQHVVGSRIGTTTCREIVGKQYVML